MQKKTIMRGRREKKRSCVYEREREGDVIFAFSLSLSLSSSSLQVVKKKE
jgi:hypothetical protein